LASTLDALAACKVRRFWDQRYPEVGDVCQYPSARNLVPLAVALASELLLRFIPSRKQEDDSATRADFAFRQFEN
jgi:molybdopterin-synthase adenylyltransferase